MTYIRLKKSTWELQIHFLEKIIFENIFVMLVRTIINEPDLWSSFFTVSTFFLTKFRSLRMLVIQLVINHMPKGWYKTLKAYLTVLKHYRKKIPYNG